MKIFTFVFLLSTLALGQGSFVAGSGSAAGTAGVSAGGGSVNITSIAVTPTGQSQNVGQTVGFIATASLSNGQTLDLTSLTGTVWTISNQAIVSFVSLTATENLQCMSV